MAPWGPPSAGGLAGAKGEVVGFSYREWGREHPERGWTSGPQALLLLVQDDQAALTPRPKGPQAPGEVTSAEWAPCSAA